MPTPAGWGSVSPGYEKPAGFIRLRAVLIGLGIVVVLGGLSLAAAQWAPGVPQKWRPSAGISLWQAERLFSKGVAAEKAGDWELARVAYISAAEVRPDARAPRWRLGRHYGAEGRFDEATAILAPVTADPPAFIHDSLLEAGNNTGLARFALAGLGRDPGRRGVWIGALRLALARCTRPELAEVAEELATAAGKASAAEAAWFRAIRAEAMADYDQMAAALREREAGGGLVAADVLLGFELWVRAGRDSEGWVWVQRHRDVLGTFEAWFADWRIMLMRDPQEAGRLLGELSPAALDASRWHRLAAAILLARRIEMAGPLEKLAASKAPPATACAAVWATLMTLGDEELAKEWAVRYRREGGSELPLLTGRALGAGDREASWRAVLLLAAQNGMPREIVSAIALAQERG